MNGSLGGMNGIFLSPALLECLSYGDKEASYFFHLLSLRRSPMVDVLFWTSGLYYQIEQAGKLGF